MKNRDNPSNLHQVIAKASCLQEVVAYVNNLDEESSKKMIFAFDKKNKLPIEYVKKSKLLPDEKSDLYKFLLPLMQPNLKPLDEIIDIDVACRDYRDNSNEKIIYNLQMGYKAVNEVRKTIFLSSTHPQINGCLEATFETLNNEIESDRVVSDRKKYNMILNSKNIELTKKNTFETILLDLKLGDDIYNAILNNQTYLSELNHRGNCNECSDLIKKFFNDRAEVFEIENGDHCFVVLDRDPNSDAADYSSWGENATVIDAWFGNVYPASEIPTQLADYKSVYLKIDGNICYYNFILPYDPDRHILQLNDSTAQNIRCKILHYPSSYAGKFIKKFQNNLSNIELFVFNEHIRPKLNDLIDDEEIDISVIENLKYPKETLKSFFLDEKYNEVLNKNLTLTEIDNEIFEHSKNQSDAYSLSFFKPQKINADADTKIINNNFLTIHESNNECCALNERLDNI